MHPVLPGLRHEWRTTPADLGTAVGRAHRGLKVLIPDQRPAQRFAPEAPGLLRTIACKLCEGTAPGEKLVIRLDDAELVAFGVCEHDVTLLRTLANVDVPGAGHPGSADSKSQTGHVLRALEGQTLSARDPAEQRH